MRLSCNIALSTTWHIVLLVTLSGCGLVANDDAGGDGQGHSGAHCSGLGQAACGGIESGLVCDTFSGECLSVGENVALTNRPVLPAQLFRPSHAWSAEAEDAQVPKQYYLDDIAAINADLQAGRISEDVWKARALVSYRHLLSQEYGLPVLEQAKSAIDQLQNNLQKHREDPVYLETLARNLAAQYQRLQIQDQRLAPLANVAAESATDATFLEHCIDEFQRFDDVVSLASPQAACAAYYIALVPRLMHLNDRNQVPTDYLKNLEATAVWVFGQSDQLRGRMLTQGENPAGFVHVRDLPIAMMLAYQLIVVPELRAQTLYAYLRMPQTVSLDAISEGPRSSHATSLGEWAQIAAHGLRFKTTPLPRRLEWFRAALVETLATLETNNQATAAFLSAATIEYDRAYELSMAMEHSELMSLYGGYDGAGQPVGFQRIHVLLLGEAKQKEFAAPTASLASALICGALSLTAGPASFATIGACLLASGIGLYQWSELAHLAAAAETLAFVGMEQSLVSFDEATRLRRVTDWTAAAAVLSVLIDGAQAIQSAPELVALAKRVGALAPDFELPKGPWTLPDWVPRFHIAQGGDMVGVLDDALVDQLNPAFLRRVNIYEPVQGPFGRVTLGIEASAEPATLWGPSLRRGTVGSAILQHYRPSHLTDEAWAALSATEQLDAFDAVLKHATATNLPVDSPLPLVRTADAPPYWSNAVTFDGGHWFFGNHIEVQMGPIDTFAELYRDVTAIQRASYHFWAAISTLPAESAVRVQLTRFVMALDEMLTLDLYELGLLSVHSHEGPLNATRHRELATSIINNGIIPEQPAALLGTRNGEFLQGQPAGALELRAYSQRRTHPERQREVYQAILAFLNDPMAALEFGPAAGQGSLLQSVEPELWLTEDAVGALAAAIERTPAQIATAFQSRGFRESYASADDLFARLALPFRRWEERPWLSHLNQKIADARQAYAAAMKAAYDSGGTPSDSAIINMLDTWRTASGIVEAYKVHIRP